MDVILCRNVTIYFERETTRKLISQFHRSLNNNGWLVVGHSEPQAELYDQFTVRNFENTVFYQKSESIISQTRIDLSNPIILFHQPPSQPVYQQSLQAKAVAPAQPINTNKNLDSDALLLQARQPADSEQWDIARDWLDKAETTGHFEAQVHYLRGFVDLNCGNYEQALQLLRKAVYCDPHFVLAHYMLGDLYQKQGAWKDAIRHWHVALGTLSRMDSQYTLPFSEDLTVEMLSELMKHRLSNEQR